MYMRPPFYTLRVRVDVRGPNQATREYRSASSTCEYGLHTSRIREKSCRRTKTRRRVYSSFCAFLHVFQDTRKDMNLMNGGAQSSISQRRRRLRCVSRACRKLYIKERLLLTLPFVVTQSRGQLQVELRAKLLLSICKINCRRKRVRRDRARYNRKRRRKEKRRAYDQLLKCANVCVFMYARAYVCTYIVVCIKVQFTLRTKRPNHFYSFHFAALGAISNFAL